ASDIVGNPLLQEFRLLASFHGPVVPVCVEFVQIDHRRFAELKSANFAGWCPRAGVIPRSYDQVMASPTVGRSELHVPAVESHRTRLVIIVMAGDRQNGSVYLCVMT